MDLFTKATGKITRRTERVELFIQTRITTLVTGKMTKNMDWESTGAMTVLGTTESGKKIRSTDQARRFDQMELGYIKETMKKVSFMVRECSVGLMGKFTLVSSLKTKLPA